jgi:hypothetical protein
MQSVHITIDVVSSNLLVEKTGGLRENHWSDNRDHIMLYTSNWSRFELTTSMVICTDCIGSWKSNYHRIMTTTIPDIKDIWIFNILSAVWSCRPDDKLLSCSSNNWWWESLPKSSHINQPESVNSQRIDHWPVSNLILKLCAFEIFYISLMEDKMVPVPC